MTERRQLITNPVQHLDAVVGDSFWRDTLDALVRANRASLAKLKFLKDETWRRAAYPYVRRAAFNELWTGTAEKHGGRATAVLDSNNSSHHLEVVVKDLLFTPVALQTSGEFPDRAEYRSTLAADSNLNFFELLGMDEPGTFGTHLYAMLAYSNACISTEPDHKGYGIPTFAFVGFPHQTKPAFVQRKQLRHIIDELLTGKAASEAAPTAPLFREEQTDVDLQLSVKDGRKKKPKESK